jgi:hypothetical protein
MSTTPAVSNQARHILQVWFGLACALSLLVACGQDSPANDTEADVAVEVDAPSELEVAIVASTLSGNVPQRISFSADLAADPADLSFQWFIDDRPYTTESSFEIVFNRAGQTKVDLVVSDTRGARAEDSVTVRLLGCGQLRFDRFTLDSPIEVAPGGEARVRLARLVNDGDAIETPFSVAFALSLDESYEPGIDPEISRIGAVAVRSGQPRGAGRARPIQHNVRENGAREVRPVEVGVRQVHASEVCADEAGVRQVRPGEDGTPQVGVSERDSFAVRVPEARTGEPGAGERGVVEERVVEDHAGAVRADEPADRDHGTSEARPRHVRLVEGDLP